MFRASRGTFGLVAVLAALARECSGAIWRPIEPYGSPVELHDGARTCRTILPKGLCWCAPRSSRLAEAAAIGFLAVKLGVSAHHGESRDSMWIPNRFRSMASSWSLFTTAFIGRYDVAEGYSVDSSKSVQDVNICRFGSKW